MHTGRLFIRFIRNRRFWKHVDVGAPGECWSWRGPTGPDGIPAFDGRPACLRAYELARGPLAEGTPLRHRCGNPWCVNPDHLSSQG